MLLKKYRKEVGTIYKILEILSEGILMVHEVREKAKITHDKGKETITKLEELKFIAVIPRKEKDHTQSIKYTITDKGLHFMNEIKEYALHESTAT